VVRVPASDVRALDFVVVARDAPKPMFQSKFLLAGGHFLWVEIFIDGFSMGSSRGALPTEGIYVALSNTRRDVKHVQSFVGTLAVLPHGVQQTTILAEISKDLVKLQRGFRVFDVASGDWVDISGAVSILPADAMQAYKMTRTLGTSATLDSRFLNLIYVRCNRVQNYRICVQVLLGREVGPRQYQRKLSEPHLYTQGRANQGCGRSDSDSISWCSKILNCAEKAFAKASWHPRGTAAVFCWSSS
jgi:hypothetical protein